MRRKGGIAIIYYTVSAPFCKFDFIPLLQNDGKRSLTENFENIPVFVDASERADISLSLADNNLLPNFSKTLCALAAGRFLNNVRGLPLRETEVDICGKIYSPVIDASKGIVTAKVGKCKQLLSKTCVKIKNVDTMITDYLYEDKRIRLARCEDSDLFCKEWLRLFFLRDDIPLCSACAVYSYDGERVKFIFSEEKDTAFKTAFGIALAIASDISYSCRGKDLIISTGIGEITVSVMGAFWAVYTDLFSAETKKF